MIDQASLESLKHDLRGECKLGFVRARSANEFEMYTQMNAKFPTCTQIMSIIAGRGAVHTAFADFLVAIIEHTEEIYATAPVRHETDYTERNVGEVESQVFPNFPVIRERAFYEKECNVEDEKSSHKAHPRPDGHDLRLSQKSCVWILTYDQW